jgi:hypothetical protein
MLRFKIERFIGLTAQRLGHRLHNRNLIIWGVTHTPFLIEGDEEFELDQA